MPAAKMDLEFLVSRASHSSTNRAWLVAGLVVASIGVWGFVVRSGTPEGSHAAPTLIAETGPAPQPPTRAPQPGSERAAPQQIPLRSRAPEQVLRPVGPQGEPPRPADGLLQPTPAKSDAADRKTAQERAGSELAGLMMPAPAGAAAIDAQAQDYTVLRGDTIARIARKYRVTPAFLMRLNGMSDARSLRAGKTIKVVQGPFRAVVDKSRFVMDIYLSDTRVESLPVGLGKDGKTPQGEWRVLNKLTNPSWVNPLTSQRYAADDPNNPIGEHWLGLEGASGQAVGKIGFGIHGTVEPQSIGQNASLGCIRLMPQDVQRVYDLLVEGASTVEVR